MSAEGKQICATKRRYERFSDAIRARDGIIKDQSMDAYWCPIHRAYHLGHDRVNR